ncbi:ligand-dependent corepressor isoform X2 [Rhineura floridana]|uniref:ligand-dependent corepressor isoform X2 n=1 Tax=Rhineura floridana TaxID=261503 RepID=UPI002AC80E3F|nr:ligand-dependent corepressor isoform X2 [Rhineura floridana]
MASLCGRQECSIERRGFRHQLDSWRHRLLRCVGFESILEGLFGPELLKDLSLFEDFEPEGVSDWSFDENCLFCCLRREKVKEHLVSLDEPALEVGHQALLRQEQAKIIRFERQAEEFLHAVFYRKDSHEVSDPNIPLVAREIMQRMIRQFAAEYTSKTSSTQDSSSPNSTKNQSLLKASLVASSPVGATAQNPVLSKLLMADQDSPLDLTVRKSQLDPCEQDGVLDLSTKKSPCAGSVSLSHSPGCSATPGNGEDAAEAIGIDCLGQPKSPLEKFMVRLCTYHQKHFVRVLNDICTEVQTGCEGQQLPGSENMDVSTCSSGCSQYRAENQTVGTSCSESKLSSSLDPEQSGPHGSLRILCHALKQAVDLKSTDRRENCSPVVRREFPELPSIRTSSASPRDSPTQGYLTASNSHYSAKSLEGQTLGSEQEMGVRKGEDDKDQAQNRALLGGYIAVKGSNVHMSEDSLEGHVGCQKNTFKAFPEETWEPGFTTNSPRRADKENALQCSSKASLHPDTEMNDQEARLKADNHLQASGKNKGSYNVQAVDKNHVENAKDSWLSTSPVPVVHHKTTNGHSRTKSNSSSTKSTRKSKRPSGLRINDYDNQCDVVYISQPITECHFESKRAISSRKTARKSTRGYYYNGECCELPTVRTLAKTSHVQESGNILAPRLEVLASPNQGASFPGDSYLAAAQVVSGEGDKISSMVVLPQEDSSNSSTQERTEPCPAERTPPEASFVKERAVSSAETSTVVPSPLPCPVLHAEEGSLSVSSLQTTVVCPHQLSEGVLQDEMDASTVLEADNGMDSYKSSRSNEDSGNIEDSLVLSASEAVDGEESSMFLESETTPELSVLPDKELPGSMALLLSEDLAPRMDSVPPLEEPASVEDLPPLVEPPSDVEPPLLSRIDLAEPPAEPPALVSLDPSLAFPPELPSIPESVCPGELAASSRVASPATVVPEPPAHIDLEPSKPPSVEVSVAVHGELDLECPQPLSDSDAAELPGSLQGANAHESINTENSTERIQDGGESHCGESEAMLPVAVIDADWGEGMVKDTSETSKADDGREANSEVPPVPKTSETGSEGGASSKTNPDKKRKREKKPQIASDRCLRSQQSMSPAENSPEQSSPSTSLQLPQLQIKLSKSPGAKRFKREVHLDGAASVCFPNDRFHKTLLNNIGDSLEQQSGDRNDITMRQAYTSLLAKKAVVEEGQNGEGNKNKAGAMLEICLEANSNRRSVHVPVGTSDKAEKQTDLKSRVSESSDNTMEVTEVVHTQCESSCPSDAGSRSESKHVPLERSVKYKKPALQFYNLRHAPAPTPALVATASKSTSGKETVQGDSNAMTIHADSNVTEEQNAQNEDTIAFSSTEVLSDNRPSFVEWCAEEENQELITNFNAQYMKVQKGWIQLEKEAQPAPKVKNKSDKLKEIWKSKKRTRKFKGSTEVQKLSPVQMLFMKGFDMSNICKWFMETTETKSLVIVKKMNTRLPGDIPLIKLPLQKGCSSGIYPSSLQAERLKKHLKKFAAMTPAKNTIKTQRLWARFRESTEDPEPEQAASSKQALPSDVSLEHAVEVKSIQPPPSMPVQTSSRILRKYSNLRGKLRGIHRVVKQDKSDSVAKHLSAESKPRSKSLCIKPLVSPKLAQQVKAPPIPTKSNLVERGGKGRKGRSKLQEDTSSKGNLQQSKKKTLNESSKSQGPLGTSSKERLPLQKASKLKHVGAPTTRKQVAAERSHKTASLNEKGKKRIDLRPGKRKPPTQKEKAKASQKAILPSKKEGLVKPLKQKVVRESSSRPPKAAAKKASSGKALTRSMKQIQESSKAQSKRKLRANKDSLPSKRRRLESK